MQRDDSSEILAAYATYLAEGRGYSPATRKAYLGAARELLELARFRPRALLLPSDSALDAIDRRALEIYLNHLRDARGWSPATLAGRLGALRAFFTWLHGTGRLSRNPARGLRIPAQRREPPLPEGDEASVRALFRQAAGTLAGARLMLLLELIYGGGLKPALAYAVLALTVAAGRGLAKAETEGGVLDLPMAEEGIARAEAYLARRDEALATMERSETGPLPFWIDARGRRLAPATLARHVRAAMARAGLAGGAETLRRLAARHFRARGADVRSLQRFLGARRLGGLERYGPRAHGREAETRRRVAETLRRVHPRHEDS